MATLKDLLASGMSRDEINALLSQGTVGTEGFDPSTFNSERANPNSYMPPPQYEPGRGPAGMVEFAPENSIRNNTTGVVTDLSKFSRPQHDVYRDGPQVMKEFQNQDGTTERIVKKPSTDGFGRQTTVLVRETVTPDYLNPAKIKQLEYQKREAEVRNLNQRPQVETPEQKRANEIIAAAERAKLPYTAEGARLAEQARADAKAKAGEEGKALPISAAKGLMENQQNLRRAQEAQALLNGQNVGKAVGDKEATGWKGYAPDALLQRFDPAGIDTRAAIADLGSLVIHDRSGAAVTAMEFPRLRPFIPSDKDDPATARKKLNRFVMEYQNIVDEAAGFYKESGYKVPSEKLKNADIKRPANDGIPPMETWVAKAKELNPDMSGAEIEAEYMKKYRR